MPKTVEKFEMSDLNVKSHLIWTNNDTGTYSSSLITNLNLKFRDLKEL